jgi:hypothetical protein
MFKRGGSSFQAQGTGITSPYDTPRKRYADGPTYEDIYSQIRETTKDPRSDWSYAAQGFGHLGDPYKESGEAKMISEMLHAGAGDVRGSREKASELEKTGELSILESQGGRLAAEEAHKRKLEEIAETGKWASKSDMLKKEPRNRQKARNRDALIKISQDPKYEFSEFTGIYLNELADGYTDGDLASGAASVINPKLYTQDDSGAWGYDSENLSADRVWFDPVTSTWLVFEDTNEDGMADGLPIYSSIDVEESITFLKQQPTSSIGSKVGTTDKVPKGDVDIKTGKLKKKGTTQEDMEQSAKETSQKIKERFKFKGDITQGVNPYKPEETLVTDFDVTENIYNKGGRVGYAEGSGEPLVDLQRWWKEQAWNNEG